MRKDPKNGEARLMLGEASLALGDYASAIRELEVARSLGIGKGEYSVPLARAYIMGRRPSDALEVFAQGNGLPVTADLLVLRARAFQVLGRRDEARASYEQALVIAPASIESLLGLAESSADPAEGLAFTERAAKIAPGDARVALARGRLYLVARKAHEAETEFRRAGELAADRRDMRVASLVGLIDAQFAQGLRKETLISTAELEQLAPTSAVARYQRARAHFANGRPDDAQQLLEQNVSSLSDGPELDASRLLLGAVHLANGRMTQADMYLSAVLAGDARNVTARQLLVESFLRQKRPSEALEMLLPALHTADTSAHILALAGRASLAAGKTDAALEYFERSTEVEPDVVARRLQLAAAYLSAGEVDRARETLDATDEETGRDALHLQLTALTHLANGDAAAAVQRAVESAKRSPSDPDLQALTGSLLFSQGKPHLARPYFERAVQLRPRSARAWFDLGRLEASAGNAKKARDCFSKGLVLEPGHPASSIALAALDIRDNRLVDALAVLSESLQVHPGHLQIRLLELRLLTATNRLDRAESQARELVEMAPGSVAARYELARTLLARGQENEAARIAQAIYTEDSRRSQAAELLGTVSLRRGDLKAAARYAEAVMLSPAASDLAFVIELAQRLDAAGDGAGAVRTYGDILRRFPDHPVALNNLAWLLHEQGDPSALQLAKRAHAVAPDDPRIIDTYAWILVEHGQLDEGLALLTPVAGANADSEIRSHYAVALERSGRRGEAKAIWEELQPTAAGRRLQRGITRNEANVDGTQ